MAFFNYSYLRGIWYTQLYSRFSWKGKCYWYLRLYCTGEQTPASCYLNKKPITRNFIYILGFINVLHVPLRRNLQFLEDLWRPSRTLDTHKEQRCDWCHFQWARGLRRRPAAAYVLRMRVRIPPVTWVSVCCVVYYQVEVCAMCRSLVQRSPTECDQVKQ